MGEKTRHRDHLTGSNLEFPPRPHLHPRVFFASLVNTFRLLSHVNMLCQACQRIFQGNFHGDKRYRNYQDHQANISNLYQSAREECWICTQLFEILLERYWTHDLSHISSTPAEDALLLVQALTKKVSKGAFTEYQLEFNEDQNEDNHRNLCLRFPLIYNEPEDTPYLFLALEKQEGMLGLY